MNNFLGKDGYYWWTGVVEDRQDPLKVGRVRVRIFGHHTDNKQLMPTEDLAWATPVYPPNNSKTFTTPTEGDWVTGYFMDGASGQFPVYTGVMPAVSTQATNPQKGFSDPRTDDQLMTAPNLPKSNTPEDDGSGSTTVNQPAVRNPATIGFPSLNALVINDPNNAPPSITQRTQELTTGIAGPTAETLGTSIAGYAQGAASALQTNLPSLTSSLTSLVPSVSSLASGLVPPNLQSQIPSTGSLTSSISSAISSATSSISSAVSSASSVLTQGFSSASDALAAASAQVSAQLASATAAASKAAADASASSGLSMSDLQAKASNIAGDIASKLASLAPANITTKIPVNLNGVAPNANLGAVTSGNLVNNLAPNPIPTQVPLEKASSTQQKSLENSITLYKQGLQALADDTINRIVDSDTTAGINAAITIWKTQAQTFIDFRQQIADTYNDQTLVDTLKQWNKTGPAAEVVSAQKAHWFALTGENI